MQALTMYAQQFKSTSWLFIWTEVCAEFYVLIAAFSLFVVLLWVLVSADYVPGVSN